MEVPDQPAHLPEDTDHGHDHFTPGLEGDTGPEPQHALHMQQNCTQASSPEHNHLITEPAQLLLPRLPQASRLTVQKADETTDKQNAHAAEDNSSKLSTSAALQPSNQVAADIASAESTKHNIMRSIDKTENSAQQPEDQHETPAQPEETLQHSSGGHE